MTRRHLAALAIGVPGFAPIANASAFGKLSVPQLESWLDAANVPGVALVIVDKGKTSFLNAGVLEAGAPAPITENTVFAAASLSKQLVAHAVHDLAEKRLWDLNRPLGDYAVIENSPDAGKVTAREVLSHSTGFPNWRSEKGESLKPGAEKGKKFRYSGEGYVYLQRVIEKITGKGFARHMKDAVLDPLGMSRSTFTWRAADPFAKPHDRQGVLRKDPRNKTALDALALELKLEPEDWTCATQEAACVKLGVDPLPNYFPMNGAASLKTSASDYARFLAVALRRPIFGERQVSFPDSAKGGGPALGWGLGWGVQTTSEGSFWWQWGDNGGFKNFVLADPKREWAIAAFTNGDKGRAVYERAIRTVKGDQPAFLWL